ncbi:MAG: hypothetical protein V3S82_08805 [Dehalococcoidia bacterium]
MSAKTAVTLGLKIVILTLLLVALDRAASVAAGLTDASQAIGPGGEMAGLLIAGALETIVLSYMILRSRWRGWPLVATVFLMFLGMKVFLSLIEAVIFLQYLVDVIPDEAMPKLFLQGVIQIALFSPLAVLVHGRMRGAGEAPGPSPRLVMPRWVWARRLILIAVMYVVIYLSFGLLVARPLAGEAFQEFYGDLRLPGWFFPFQLLRGLMFTALALPVIRMMKGRQWEAGLAVGLAFSVLMAAGLLVPGEFFPTRVRMAHFVEVMSSNFLFGWTLVWLLNRPYGSPLKLSERAAESA